MSSERTRGDDGKKGGIIAWMVRNRVTPNLLMIFLLGAGFVSALKIKQEVFPEFDLDIVNVRVSYPGASPQEVERGIILPMEEALRGLDGIKEMSSTASEGSASLRLELLGGADASRVRQEIEQAVDRVRTLPLDAEDPSITLSRRRREVVSLVLYGDVSETVLRELAERTQDGLLQSDDITQIDIVGGRAVEIHVEISQETLRSHELTLNQVASRIAAASVDLPGGRIDTESGEIMLRVTDRRDWADEFATIPIQSTDGGHIVRLEDLATVSEGFEDVDRASTYDGLPSIELSVFRVGDQTPIGVSDAIQELMPELEADLPDGVSWVVRNDRSDHYRQRLQLLMRNLFLGLTLVLILLGLFLELRVAFWVTMGIPISFLGGLLFLPGMGVSINMISMFAFIVALGIVVDDAIVAGENIYEYRSKGMSLQAAAIAGARDVAGPIGFSILTNIVAFLPLYFVPGFVGKIWRVIPMVVITVFIISWVESLLILPAHLGHGREGNGDKKPGPLRRFQLFFNRGVTWFATDVYGPILRLLLRWRFITVAAGVAVLIATIGYVKGGHIGIIFMPRTESDTAYVGAQMPPGSPFEEAVRVRDELVDALRRVVEANGGDELLLGVSTKIDGNTIGVSAYLTPPHIRPIPTSEVTQEWRSSAGAIAGIERLRFEYDRHGPGSGAGLTIELSHRDVDTLERAAAALAESLEQFPNVSDVDEGRSDGKQQIDFSLTPAGESLGLTSREIARQVRSSFWGAEAVRQQRQSDEVRVFVRLPESERASESDLESLLISTPSGRYVPLGEVAHVERGRSFTSIPRRDARRVVTVSANVNPIGETQQVMEQLDATVLPGLVADFPGLTQQYRGSQFRMAESMGALGRGFLIALICIYFLLAIPFKSYIQPLIVMVAIPFGIVGAVLGHIIMDFNLSLMSMMGLVALSGVLVNDSLLLVDYANKRAAAGVDIREAISQAGIRRFRPVLLTTLTTFGGLAPMIFETSRQARFLIPMALSVGFGILFATVITLVLVPSLFLVVEDLRAIQRRISGFLWDDLFGGARTSPDRFA